MKKVMIGYMQNQKNDEYYTPEKAIYPLLPFLPRDKVYWECTDFGNSNITKVLKEYGYKVITSHINEGIDFLESNMNGFDIIITNPPYSMKNKFLEKAYSYNKPFCFLLPITTLEGTFRSKLFRKYGIEILVLDKRINFIGSRKNVWFNSSWFCWNILPEKLIFTTVK